MVDALLQTHFCACCCGRCCYCCCCCTCCSGCRVSVAWEVEDNVQCVAFFSPRRPLFPFLHFSPPATRSVSRASRAALVAARHTLRQPRAVRRCWPLSIRTRFNASLFCCHLFFSIVPFLGLDFSLFSSLLRSCSFSRVTFLARPEHSLLCLAPLEPSLHSLALPEPFSVLALPALSSPLLEPPALCSLPLAPPALSSAPLPHPVLSSPRPHSPPACFLLSAPNPWFLNRHLLCLFLCLFVL